jgi:tetratricopeptide (TPR) repeat protein
LPEDVEELRDLAGEATAPEDAIAINTAILRHAPDDVVAMNRLGRAYEAIGSLAQAKEIFERAVAVDPDNAIAVGRLRDLVRGQRR